MFFFQSITCFVKKWVCLKIICLVILSYFCQIILGQIHSNLNQTVNISATEAAKHLEKVAASELFQWNKQSLESSQKHYLEASQIWEKLGDFYNSTHNINQAGKVEKILDDNKTAENLFLKALEVSTQNGVYDEQINSLCELSLLNLKVGNHKKANQYFLIANQRIHLINNNQIKGFFWFTSGEFEYSKRNIQKAIENYKYSIEFVSNSNNLSEKSNYLRFLAFAYLFEENYNLAISSLEESLTISTSIGDKREQVLSQIVLAHTKSRLNNKQTALNYYHQAESLFPNDIDIVEKARLMNAIGNILKDFGEFQLSIDYRKSALKLFDQANYPYGKLATLSSLGMLHTNIGEFEKAKSYLLQSEFWAKKLNDNFYLAITLEELGNLTFYEGNYERANKYYNQSLKYLLSNNLMREIAFIYNRLGQIKNLQNKIKISKRFFKQSLDLHRKIQNKFGESETLYQLAKLDLFENNSDAAAITNVEESIKLTENLYSDVSNSNLKRSYFSTVYDRYELYIHLLMQKHKESPNQNFSLQALQASEKSRSRSLLETLRLSEVNFTKDANPELVSKEKDLRNLLSFKADKLTELLSNSADKIEIEKVEDEIRNLENDLENVKADLKQNSPIYSAIKNPPPFEVAEFQQNILDYQTVLLEFSLGENESYLWLIGKNEVTHYILPARNIIETRIDKIRQTFENRQKLPEEEIEVYQNRINDLENTFNQEAKVLSNELLGQIAEKIRDKRLIIVPDGKLQYLPLSVLPLPNSDEPLIQHNELVYEPSASLLNLLAKTQSKKIPTKDLIVFADPVFNNSDTRLLSKNENEISFPPILGLNLRDFQIIDGNGKIPRLFASQDEADAIQNVVGKYRSVIASGFEASRNRVLNSDISDYRILHFATHGLVDVERPEISSIVLSQFDKNGDKSEGFLRLQDIYSLDLMSDLVVLSACQSGIGKEIKGEGLMSLNSAFLQAGAKSVLSSSWKVDDYATAELMKYFYQGLIEKQLPPAEALRQAQLKMRENPQFSSPFYWAAFTLQGEFRQPVLVKKGSYYYLIGFIILGVLFLGILLWHKFYRTVKL